MTKKFYLHKEVRGSSDQVIGGAIKKFVFWFFTAQRESEMWRGAEKQWMKKN